REKGILVPDRIMNQLALANLYGWMAYTIYDDVLDDESDGARIPCANFFLRAVADIYRSLDREIPGAIGLYTIIMDRIDGANAWEQSHCRVPGVSTGEISDFLPSLLPNFGDHTTLADRSIGHG